MGLGEGMMKAAASKALVIKTNLAFLTIFIIFYVFLLLQPPSLYNMENAPTVVRCTLHDCSSNKVGEVKSMKNASPRMTKESRIPSFYKGLSQDAKIAVVNMGDDEASEWKWVGETVEVKFEIVSQNMEWKHLFPEWIDEEEENEGTSCPEVPMPDFNKYGEVEVVAVRVPCRMAEEGWARDVKRLQVHLVAAEMAVRRGRRDVEGKVKVAVASGCRPMMELFRCDDLVAREGEWWLYQVDVGRLADKVGMPVGSCKLALPLWRQGTNEKYDTTSLAAPAAPNHREAYATVLHSSNMYVCGAIALAQSILHTNTTRDLILLHDSSIPADKLSALASAGWKLRLIKRIRNPRAERYSYNEYNYSKLRLWQLTEYRKVVFVDADIAVLRSLDLLFRFPQISAVGNDNSIFNSGIMVLEPSNCTFKVLMGRRKDVVSYNGGDQGFLNEIFVWWHRLPRRVNFLKNFWSNRTAEVAVKESLFRSDPAELYSIHYLGFKPWLCYRDYDCNFDVEDHLVYASDVAHARWWRVHDEMEEGLKGFCALQQERKEELEMRRKNAEVMGLGNQRWKIQIKDRRKYQ